MKKAIITSLIFLLSSFLLIAGTTGEKPDLIITGIKVTPLQSKPQLKLNISITVKNIGKANVMTPFIVRLYYRTGPENSWIRLKDWKCSPVPAEAEKTFSFGSKFKKNGTIKFRAEADVLNQVDEASESNNFYETPIELQNAIKVYNYPQNLEITVTVPRMEIPLRENPAATSVVGREVLQSMPRSIAAEEALFLVPGVKVENQADGERVHLYIRGQGILSEHGIRGIKLLLDGLPLNDPTGFAPDLYDVDWATLEKIEVLRGPSASLYGGGAAGGIINILTEDGGEKPLNVNGLFSLGSYAFGKALLNVGGTKGDFNYRISASRNQGNGYREHTKFWANNVYGKFHWTPSSSVHLTAIIAWTDFYNDNAEGLNLEWLRENRRMANPDALTYNEYQKTQRATSGLTGQIKISDSQELSFATYYRNTHYRESVPSSVDHRFYHTPGFTFQYKIHMGKGWLKNHLIIGSDLEWQNMNEYRHPNLGKAVEGLELLSDQVIYQRSSGVYVIDRAELGPDWAVVFSLRHDDIHNELDDHLKEGGIDLSGSARFKENTGRVGIAWNPKPSLGLYANWGMGFLPPSTEELANNPDFLGGFNSHLKSAISSGEEIGARGYIGNSLFYDVTLFHLHTDNDFGRYRIPSRPLETFYRNVGSTRRYGLETFLAWYPVEQFQIQLAYTYSHFKYISFETEEEYISGTYLPNSPKHRLSMNVQYNPAKRWTLGVRVEAQSRSYVDFTNEAWADGYAIFNARIAYRISDRLEFTLYGRNLFNKEYIAFTEPDPDGNSYQPAATREVFAGLRFKL